MECRIRLTLLKVGSPRRFSLSAAVFLALLLGPRPVIAQSVEALPSIKPVGAVAHADVGAPKVMPITLEAVLQLAHDQNLQVEQARAKVAEAEAKVDLAHKKCIPLKKHGSNVLLAEQNYWHQKAELSRLTADTMLDASTTYIDLVAALTGRAIVQIMLFDLEDLVVQANNRAKAVPGAQVEVARTRTEIEARKATILQFEAQAAAAAAKLIYLLNLDPCTVLLPVDRQLRAIDVVDAATPTCDLVARALSQGPGIRELESLVGVMDNALQRCDAYWVLIYCRLAHEARRIAEAQRAQAHLALQDLRGKLTAGVQEAREAILKGLLEIRETGQEVAHSAEARKLSKDRLKDIAPGSSPSEVLLSLQALVGARLNYLSVVRDYDKAQLRLLIFTGGPGGHGASCPANGASASPAVTSNPPEQLPTPRQQAQ